ncbi:phosphomannomutase [Corynebacterium yudongzhengii]|uniref:Phospho-sugar mutase n=1 Tax=Corynebacterium yudongzhengii TaxID=2080740 RepID=A0A2U1T6L2_9CORY|nr:phospho-sugar mutase [Corynebacterium yudongzhengii]AWB81669.1 phosphomannomutase [Corynebacterium yudongzhengii]PWC01528.1 phospho-sugar mutase [Corynebacterium yudongzhengii]
MDLQEKVRAWIAHDPDPTTRAELQELLDHGDTDELSQRFSGPLEFGTAGLRGRIEGGENRMNIATVIRASAGVAAWLRTRVYKPRVVVGCDARHRSRDFYTATCEVLNAAGCEVIALPAEHPTPLTSFAVRHVRADAGIMITASHNPAWDNGYKVYLGGRIVDGDNGRGVQLISPADQEISAAIAATGPADSIARKADGITFAGPEIREAYLARAVSLIDVADPHVPIVVTALHGVGGDMLVEALRRAGFSAITPVAQQHEPDPDFPTVAFPNPEEDGALDLAIATARQVGARVILALDPDADRCSVAIPAGSEGQWEQLSGDTIGAILGEQAAKAGEGVMAASIVSSQVLSAIAKAHGLDYQPTLTGFKWIGRVENLVYGYEEAIGYCTDPQAVRDKDGITACLRVAELASGGDLADYLAEIDAAYGAWVTRPLTVRMDDPAEIRAKVDGLLGNPPADFGGSPVTEVADLSRGYQGVPGTAGVLLRTEEGARIVARPSGTEPKLKCYIEVIRPQRAEAVERCEQIKAELASVLGVR